MAGAQLTMEPQKTLFIFFNKRAILCFEPGPLVKDYHIIYFTSMFSISEKPYYQ